MLLGQCKAALRLRHWAYHLLYVNNIRFVCVVERLELERICSRVRGVYSCLHEERMRHVLPVVANLSYKATDTPTYDSVMG